MKSSARCKECGNNLWDAIGDIAKCTNCLTPRPYVRRKRNKGQITPTQQAGTKRIKEFFEGHGSLETFEIELQDTTGIVFIKVEVGSNVFTMHGGFFAIGRRGLIHVLSSYSLYTKEDHYAKMLKGKVGW